MTEEQRDLCRKLIIQPDGLSRISKEEFLRCFPSCVEHGNLASSLLETACSTQNAEDLQNAVIIGCIFGFEPAHMHILCRLIDVDWHYSHELIVAALERWRSPDTVEALFRATQWIPTSLDYDESRALAVKAIWELGKIPGPEAEVKLQILAHSDDAILRVTAAMQIDRRRKGSETGTGE